jgi:hypothetical protein
MRELGLIMCVLLGGCMLDEQGPGKKLTEAVREMDKATRWGQTAEAARMVDATYRERFISNHVAWGQQIQLGDSEVVNIEIVPSGETATAMMQYQWYLSDAMTLHQTVVRQRWTRADNNGYALISEAIVQGDARLFAANPEGLPEPAAIPDQALLGAE